MADIGRRRDAAERECQSSNAQKRDRETHESEHLVVLVEVAEVA